MTSSPSFDSRSEPQQGQLVGAGITTRSRGSSAGNGLRAGFRRAAGRALITDNGSAYRSRDFREAIAAANLRPIRTRPYTPGTNGKAERFIQSGLREWAYAQPFTSSQERSNAMQSWIETYNHHRRRGGVISTSAVSTCARVDTS